MSRRRFNHRPSPRYQLSSSDVVPGQPKTAAWELPQSQPAPPLLGSVEQKYVVVGESRCSGLHVIWTELNADPTTG